MWPSPVGKYDLDKKRISVYVCFVTYNYPSAGKKNERIKNLVWNSFVNGIQKTIIRGYVFVTKKIYIVCWAVRQSYLEFQVINIALIFPYEFYTIHHFTSFD